MNALRTSLVFLTFCTFLACASGEARTEEPEPSVLERIPPGMNEQQVEPGAVPP